jgi:hypothetical protein
VADFAYFQLVVSILSALPVVWWIIDKVKICVGHGFVAEERRRALGPRAVSRRVALSPAAPGRSSTIAGGAYGWSGSE